MNQLQFLPVSIPDSDPGEVGVVNGYPVSTSINRLIRWWKVKSWKLSADFRFSNTIDPVIVWRFKRDIVFLNHKIQGNSLEEVPFEVANVDQLLFPRMTSYKERLPIGIPIGNNINPEGWFSFRLFSLTEGEAVKKVGSLYYPRFELKFNLITTEMPEILLQLLDDTAQSTGIVLGFDGLGIPGLSTLSVGPEEVVWGGGKVIIQPVDYWY